MTLLNRTTMAVGLALALSPLAHATEMPATALPAARSLIDAHIAASGGAEAYAKSGDGTTKVQMEIVENGMKLDMTMYGRGSDRASLMAIPGAGDFRSGYTGGVAWSMDPMNGPRLLDGREREQIVEQGDPRISMRDPGLVASATTVALSESEGRPCYRVEIKWTSGRETIDCYGTEDGLLLSTESVIASPMGDMKQVSHMSEYKSFGAVKLPSKMKGKAAGMTQLITIQSYDPAAPAAEVFALPTAIEALVKKSATATSTQSN
ncbi:MAG: hypothetical protein HOP03_01790 [Lysobacter sp.]|nr:hypothetical protein [Lysobacter sp.]